MTGQADYFRTFCTVSRAFGTTLGKDEILDLIVQSVVETMQGKAACLFLADEEKDIFVPVAQKGLSQSYLHVKPMQAKKVVDEILTGGHLSVYDACTDTRLENLEEKKAEGIASILVVPVMVEDKAIGVLSLYTSTHTDFSEDEVNFMSALAEQGGLAIERARLFERIARNSQLFFDLARKVNSSLDIKNIMQILTTDLCEALGMKGVEVRLLNKDAGTLDLVASCGLSAEYLDKDTVTADKAVGLALKGETTAIRDVTSDDRVQHKEEATREGVVSMLCVPIESGDEVIGILRLCSGVEQEFPEDVINLVNAVGHQGGLAIRNASLYLMLEQDKKDLEEDIWSHKSWF